MRRAALTVGNNQHEDPANLSPRCLLPRVTVTNATLSAAHAFALVLDGRSKAELGHLQGWSFASGDVLLPASGGCDEQTIVVP